tara:strand:+ start:35777 stop:36424 length:648 start_codon:yes stop_codon:yes gene_type:complete
MSKGLMIVVDGSNGAGKTTVIKKLEEFLVGKKLDVVLTREPGGTSISEKVRDIILDKENSEMCDLTELLLFAASRAQHVQEKIIPAIENGSIVISDRFDAATISFQHYARGIDLELITKINDIAKAGFQPDMNIILDLPPEIGLERVHGRGDKLDRMEDEKMEFLANARNGYLEQAKASPDKFTVIDASKTKEEVAEEAISCLEELLTSNKLVNS